MKKEISRQRKWQLKKNKEGKCTNCGKKAVTKYRCQKHRIMQNKSTAKWRRRNKQSK